jgi:hypothetical protein
MALPYRALAQMQPERRAEIAQQSEDFLGKISLTQTETPKLAQTRLDQDW